MIVYFENGWLNHHRASLETGEDLIEIDAGMGYNNCRRKLRYIKDNCPFNTKVYTNSLDAFSNFWCWDDENKKPMIYIRDKNEKWKLIWDMADIELRRAHNLEKMYVNGVFCDVET